jgi:hypothetical protein
MITLTLTIDSATGRLFDLSSAGEPADASERYLANLAHHALAAVHQHLIEHRSHGYPPPGVQVEFSLTTTHPSPGPTG